MIQWHCKKFDQLSLHELYELLKLRQDVFVIEQRCIYPELDDADQQARHLLGRDSVDGGLSAYARLFEPGIKYPQSAIGRVVIDPAQRGAGLGKEVMLESIRRLEDDFPSAGIKLSAQQHLEPFYQSLGFEVASDAYDDEGIMHIDMIKAAI